MYNSMYQVLLEPTVVLSTGNTTLFTHKEHNRGFSSVETPFLSSNKKCLGQPVYGGFFLERRYYMPRYYELHSEIRAFIRSSHFRSSRSHRRRGQSARVRSCRACAVVSCRVVRWELGGKYPFPSPRT